MFIRDFSLIHFAGRRGLVVVVRKKEDFVEAENTGKKRGDERQFLLLNIPSNTEVSLLNKGEVLEVKGPQGLIEYNLAKTFSRFLIISLINKEKKIKIMQRKQDRNSYALLKTAFSILGSLLLGVNKPFSKRLEIVGTGYRAEMGKKEDGITQLILHFRSASPHYYVPSIDGVKVSCPSEKKILVEGISKEDVGQVARLIRNLKPPGRYKGEGIRYEGEIVSVKRGKVVKSG